MYRVLLVDDEPITKLGIRKLMEKEVSGFALAGTASNGLQALQYIHEHPVDIVITDLKMPQMDGLALIHALSRVPYDGAILVLSNYSDFELVREALLAGAVDYMLKVNITAQVLQTQLQNAAEHIANTRRQRKTADEHDRVRAQNRRLLHTTQLRDFFSAPHPPEEAAFTGDICAEFAQWRGGLQLLDIVVRPKNRDRLDRKIPLEGIAELLHSIFEATPPVVFAMQAHELLCLVASGDPSESSSMRERAEQIGRQLGMYYDLEVVVILPKPATDLSGAYEKYKQCKSAQELFFYSRAQAVIVPERIVFTPWLSQIDSGKAISRIEQHYADPEGLEEYLTRLLEQCAAGPVAPEEVRRFFFRVVEQLHWGYVDSDMHCPTPLVGILDAPTAEALAHGVLAAVAELWEKALPPEAGNYKKEVKNALLYIRVHYSKKITLEELAAAVSLNPSYLCRLFKRETGESIFQYIGRLRMRRAAALMDGGQTYIRGIASSVGVEDPFYFTRLFKRYYGVSPSEYLCAKE